MTPSVKNPPVATEPEAPGGIGGREASSVRRGHLLAAAAVIAVVYLAGVIPLWRPTPDSALYLSLARSLADGEGFRFNGETQVHRTVTPGLPLILAGVRMIFGEAFWAPNLLVALCGMGALGLVYAVVRQLSEQRTALATLLITAFSYVFYVSTHKVLTDAVFALVFWALLWTYLRRRRHGACQLGAMALLSAAGVFIRAPGLLILGPLSLAIALTPDSSGRRGGRLRAAGAILLPVILLAGALFAYVVFVARESPVYFESVASGMERDVLHHVKRLTAGAAATPFAMTETLTSQDGFPIAIFGFTATIFAVVGSAGVWRSGQRFVPLTVLLSLLALACVGGGDSVRPRYILPIAPLMIYLSIRGLELAWKQDRRVMLLRLVVVFSALAGAWYVLEGNRPYYYPLLLALGTWLTVEAFASLAKRFSSRPGALPTAVAIFTALCVAISMPRVLRDAFYYSYLSRTGQYYRKIRKGSHAEIHQIAEFIRKHCPPDNTVATRGDKVSIFHFLSGRRIVYDKGDLAGTARDARTFARFVAENEKVRLVVLVVKENRKKKASGNYVDRATKLLDAMDDLERFDYPGEHYRVYRRVTRAGARRSGPVLPPAAPATGR